MIFDGGAAGLGAAHRAVRSGLKLIVLEAASRIGDRAKTERTQSGQLLDLGCHWLQGDDRNPSHSLAKSVSMLGPRITSYAQRREPSFADMELTRSLDRSFGS